MSATLLLDDVLMFMADLHIHTNKSDGKMHLHDVIDLYGARGFGAIAITDHLCESRTLIGKSARFMGCSLTEVNFSSYIDELSEEAARAWRQYKMLVIPGFEVTMNTINNHRSAHILALGVRNYINPNQDIVSICRNIREHGGLAVAAHPVSTRKWEKQTYHLWDRRHELAPEFDAWEVASGPHLFTEVLHSGLPLIANSDLHGASQISSWKTVFHCEKNEEAMKNAIRKQDLQFHFYRDALAQPRLSNLNPLTYGILNNINS